ncbi:hypothetical protein [Aquimarina agarilytica]|uniref:hypothetical protein n=1 Tax=Aquimarina agarilytica TaxID=1087449 RepID=UPI00028A103E|nr:hypothetical protein [Aquimarina agarilytica]
MKAPYKTYSTYFKLMFIISIAALFSIGCNKKPKVVCATSDNVTYTKDIAPIIEVKCFKCHDAKSYKTKASHNKIYDYPSLKKMAESGLLMGSLTHKKGFIPMPYRAKQKIDTCAIALIASWINTGMKK